MLGEERKGGERITRPQKDAIQLNAPTTLRKIQRYMYIGPAITNGILELQDVLTILEERALTITMAKQDIMICIIIFGCIRRVPMNVSLVFYGVRKAREMPFAVLL